MVDDSPSPQPWLCPGKGCLVQKSSKFRSEAPGWDVDDILTAYPELIVAQGSYDPCNRTTMPYNDCMKQRVIEPIPQEYTNPKDGCTYKLMTGGDFPGPGRCGSSECACIVTGITSPLVVDLIGQGVKYTDYGQHIDFDLGGGPMPTTWIKNSAQTPWLVWDRNQDGKISDVQEMFGNNTLDPGAPAVGSKEWLETPPEEQQRNGFMGSCSS